MILTRYLSKEIAQALFTILTILMLIFVCQQMLRYFNYVTVGKFPVSILFQLVLYELPFLLTLLLPLALYLSLLLTYSRLHADSEMQVIHASGFGPLALSKFTLLFAAVIAMIVLGLVGWVNPAMALKRQVTLAHQQGMINVIQTLTPGRFHTGLGDYVVYVEKLSRDRKRAEQLFIAEEKKSPEKNSWTLILANQGYQLKDSHSAELYFVAADGNRYQGIPGQNDFNITAFKRYAIRIPSLVDHPAHQEEENLSLGQLWKNKENLRYAAEWQWRLSISISALLLALLAIPLSRLKPRQGRFTVILPAILIYIIYLNLLFAARRFMVSHWIPAVIGLWWVHGLLLLGIILLMRNYIRK